MKLQTILMYVILGVCVLLVLAFFQKRPAIPLEAFEVSACPQRAHRNAEGEIVVQPGDHRFKTMSEYVSYLKKILDKDGNPCIPPMVEPHRGVEPGILGGLGMGHPLMSR